MCIKDKLIRVYLTAQKQAFAARSLLPAQNVKLKPANTMLAAVLLSNVRFAPDALLSATATMIAFSIFIKNY